MKRFLTRTGAVFSVLSLLPAVAMAETPEGIDAGDTGFMLICTAMVLLMTPALGFYYGGIGRSKNMLNVLMMSFILLGITSVQWVLFGYSTAFAPTVNGFFGGSDFWLFQGVGLEPYADYAPTIPAELYSMFQMVFVMITPAIIGGAVAGRMRFTAFCLLMFFWMSLVYEPLCHMVWAKGGFIGGLGALDFAGGTVVHISSGVSALVAAVVVGKRYGYPQMVLRPHNLSFMALGCAFLWFGWLAFCGGCAGGGAFDAVHPIFTTNTAAGAGMLVWLLIEKLHDGKMTILGACTGGISGLVGITPSCGYVTVLSALAIGALTAPVCYFAIAVMKKKAGYDDALDAFGCHGVGGMWGAMLTGVFCSHDVNPLAADGLIYGNAGQLLAQFEGVVITILIAAVFTFLILKGINLFVKLRVNEEEEKFGMDYSEHGENAYSTM